MGLNNAMASVALGSMHMSRWHQLRIAVLFALFEAMMPVLGLWIGEELAGVIGSKAKFVGIIVLAAAGLYSLLKRDKEDASGPKSTFGIRTILLAVALSLDNLTVGFGLGMFHAPIILAAVVFGSVSLCMSLLGLEVGRYLGERMSISTDKLSGIVLLVTAGLMFLH